MGALANSQSNVEPDEMTQYAAFHQGLHCLLRLKQPSGNELHLNLKIPKMATELLEVNKELSQCMRFSNNVVCATSKVSDQPAHTHSLIRAFASRLSIL